MRRKFQYTVAASTLAALAFFFVDAEEETELAKAGKFKSPASGAAVPEVVEEVRLLDLKDPDDDSDDVTIASWDGTHGLFEENIAWIDAHPDPSDPAPRMPSLALEFGEDNPAKRIEAALEVDYVRGNGFYPDRNQEHDYVRVPAEGFATFETERQVRFFEHTDWVQELSRDGFFGGEAQVLYRVLGEDDREIGKGKLKFRIGGRNPEDDIAKAWIQAVSLPLGVPKMPFMYAIAKHESKGKNADNLYYNQFYELPRHKEDVGRPVWHNDGLGMPGGYGIFQVTGSALNSLDNVPRRMIWNWQDNVDAAYEIMTHKIKRHLAERYFVRIRREVGEAVFNACPPPRIPVGRRRVPVKTAIWITGYNGWGGAIKNRFLYQKDRPCGLGADKRWHWNPPIKPSGKTYLELIVEEIE